MVAIPTVNSFCGCCDLKVSCIVIASLRIIGNIIAILAYIFAFYVMEQAAEEIEKESAKSYNLDENDVGKIKFALFLGVIYFIIKIIISIINIFVSYWFIMGATSKQIHKMKYYVIIVGADVVILLLLGLATSLVFIVAAAIESYIFICSYSLYKALLSPFQEGATNTNDINETAVIKNELNPAPPPYNSFENDMQGPSAASYSKQYP